jgi:two-component system, cell cycle response regulator DivK
MPPTAEPPLDPSVAAFAVIALDRTMRVTRWNHAAEELTGYAAGDVVGRTFYEFLIPRTRRTEALNVIGDALDGRVWEGALLFQHASGERVPVTVTVAPVFDQARHVASVVVSGTAADGPVGSDAPVPELKRGRILVAEDDPRSRELMVELLRDAGHEVTAVPDGQDAIDVLQDWTREFDMAVLDMQMPRVSGLEVVAAIRRDARLRSLVVLAVTALTQPGDAARVLEAGCDAYVAKPVSTQELRRLVTSMLADTQSP